jgi:hypothetical protein
MDSFGRVISRTQNSPHGVGAPSSQNPFDFTSAMETGEQALARYRGLYAGARQQGLLRNDARNFALRQMDEADRMKLSAADVRGVEQKDADNLGLSNMDTRGCKCA